MKELKCEKVFYEKQKQCPKCGYEKVLAVDYFEEDEFTYVNVICMKCHYIWTEFAGFEEEE